MDKDVTKIVRSKLARSGRTLPGQTKMETWRDFENHTWATVH